MVQELGTTSKVDGIFFTYRKPKTYERDYEAMKQESLIALYEACCQTPPCLLTYRIREAIIRCACENGEDPPSCEDDPTPEVLLHRSASAIQGLLENVGFFDNDGLAPLPDWPEAHDLSQEISNCLSRNHGQ